MEVEMEKWCNFKDREVVFTVEGIIKSCFYNPLRKKFAEALKNSATNRSEFCADEYEIEHFMRIINQFSQASVGKFNRELINPYETGRIFQAKPEFNLNEGMWFADLETQRWYGPYTFPQSYKAFFISKPSNGDNSGFRLLIDLNPSLGSITFFHQTQGQTGYLYQF